MVQSSVQLAKISEKCAVTTFRIEKQESDVGTLKNTGRSLVRNQAAKQSTHV